MNSGSQSAIGTTRCATMLNTSALASATSRRHVAGRFQHSRHPSAALSSRRSFEKYGPMLCSA
jgi:hypothetical protein